MLDDTYEGLRNIPRGRHEETNMENTSFVQWTYANTCLKNDIYTNIRIQTYVVGNTGGNNWKNKYMINLKAH